MRLNLGSGARMDPQWIHVDRAFAPTALVAAARRLVVLDITKDAWPWPDSSVEGIVIHHVLDLIDPPDVHTVLTRCFKVLLPGAVLRISLADLDKGIDAALRRDDAWFAEPQYRNLNAGVEDVDFGFDLEQTLGFFITQGGARKQHLTVNVMRALLGAAGFAKIFPVDFNETVGNPWITDLDSREAESWWIEAVR